MSAQMSPPPGGDVNKGPMFLGVTVSGTVVATITLFLRLYARARFVKTIGWDDGCIIFATLLNLTGMGMNIAQVHYGMGRHIFYLENDPESLIMAVEYTELAQPFMIMSVAFTKASLCLFLLRIVNRIKMYKYSLWIILWFTMAFNICLVLLILLQCIPLPKLWDRSLEGTCLPAHINENVALAQGAYTVLTDWMLAFFPTLIVKKLNMPRRVKFALAVIMGLGFFVGACALIRTVELPALANTTDVTYDLVPLACWSITEMNVGIIAVNVPPIRPLFAHVLEVSSRNASAYRKGASQRFGTHQSVEMGTMSGTRRGAMARTADAAMWKEPEPSEEELATADGRESYGSCGIVKTVTVTVRDEGMELRNGGLTKLDRNNMEHSWTRLD